MLDDLRESHSHILSLSSFSRLGSTRGSQSSKIMRTEAARFIKI